MKINKIIIFTFINFCFILGSNAQTFPVTEKVVGRNLLTNKDIIAKEYITKKEIYNFRIDTISKSITIQTRKYPYYSENSRTNGRIYFCSSESMQVKWSKKIDFFKNNLLFEDSIVLIYNEDNISLLNLETGEKLWKINNNKVFNNSKIGLGLLTSPHTEVDDILIGFELKTGKKIWEKNFLPKNNIEYIQQINDSVIIIIADGIHYVNLKNGKSWDVASITNSKEYRKLSKDNAKKIASSIITYAVLGSSNIFIPLQSTEYITNINSNVLSNNNGEIYFASKNEIIKTENNGKVIWRTNLPFEHTSSSHILQVDSIIIMINMGVAYQGETIKYGSPFIAAFNNRNGQIIFQKMIDIEYITSFLQINDTLIIISEQNICKYSTLDGSILKNHKINTSQIVTMTGFVKDEIFIKADSNTFKQLNKLDTSKLYISSNTGNIIELDNNLNITNYFNSNQYFICKNYKANLKLLFNENKSFVIDYSNNKVCELNNITEDAIIVNNKIYDFIDNKFIIIELY